MYSKAVQTLCNMAKYKAVKMKVTGAHLRESGSQQDVYSVGYDTATTDFFHHRSAASHAAFFLPYVQPGMTLLDCGCGPGTITLDLASIVAPAEVVGVDIEPSQLRFAWAQAADREKSNARFTVADLYALPFSDSTFDAVFLHGVLEHMQEPVAALGEVRRVLKPGGVVGARHADFGGFLLEPAEPPLDRFVPLFERLMVHNGGDPTAGRHQLRWLRETGFDQLAVSASCDCWTSTPEETQRHAGFLAELVGESAFASQLIEAGIADNVTLVRMSEGFIAWGRHPHAFAAEAWGEAVAQKS